MSAQFITHDEFDAGQDRFFMRLTAFMTGQLDLIRTQAREDKRELMERFGKIETDIAGMKTDIADLKTTQTAMQGDIAGMKTDIADLKTTQAQIITVQMQTFEAVTKLDRRVSDVEASQTTLKAATEGALQDISKQIADSHAALMEQINQLKKPPEQ